MSGTRFEPFYLDGAAGRILAVFRAPQSAQKAVMFVPPFGEEMNKSRRQVTEVVDRLIDSGLAVLVVDLYGTGDSQGEFAESSWDVWRSDIECAFSWVERAGFLADSLIAMRTGCLLAADSLRHHRRSVDRSVFWQPVFSGRQFMTQFLRLRVAASMMSDESKENIDDLNARLGAGDSIEVSGYELAPSLWRDFQSLDLNALIDSGLGEVAIMEVGRSSVSSPSVPSRRFVDDAKRAGIAVDAFRVAGEPFWTSTEIVTNRGLTEKTVESLTRSGKE